MAGLDLLTAGLGAGAGILGGLLGAGKKPKVPPFMPVDVTGVQNQGIQGDISSLPQAEKLASEINTFSQDQILNMLRKSVPNFDQLQSQIGGNIASGLKGEVPQDVANQISSNAAARALRGGVAGTGFHGNLVAKDIGQTSYGIQQQAMSSVQNWLQSTKSLTTPQAFNLSSVFIDPSQRLQSATSDRNLQMGLAQQQSVINAAPNLQNSFLGGFLGNAGGQATGIGLQGMLSSLYGNPAVQGGGNEFGTINTNYSPYYGENYGGFNQQSNVNPTILQMLGGGLGH